MYLLLSLAMTSPLPRLAVYLEIPYQLLLHAGEH